MKERPILMSAPMVMACLREVDPKTQTRRAMNPQPASGWAPESPPVLGRITSPHSKRGKFGVFLRRGLGTDFPEADLVPCPYGQPGDRLYVRENGWQRPERTAKMMREGADTWKPYYYDADGLTEQDVADFKAWGFKRRPSIHMPREHSRIQLEIVSLRVERLQDISEADAMAEGCKHYEPANYLSHGDLSHDGRYVHATAIASYKQLWNSINGAGSWAGNPWVWVVDFKRITA